ncbi:M56 family metallopeptidase [Kitasatospora terrestris]|uniref:M48 family metalloprotease n=1 Tax=Kitasatospora terrestris TaxID=258051 RepID=A0ABP9EFT4_9ACTN
MTWAIWAPLLAPWITVPAARRLAALLPPRWAALLLTLATAVAGVLAGTAVALLAADALLHLPPVAALGHLSPPLLPDGPVTLALGCAALPVGAASAWAAVRTLRRHDSRRYHAAIRGAAAGRAGDLVVLPDAKPDAFALPGRPGTVVVTSGMLGSLAPDEQAVLLAHERAHLRCRHHLLALTADLAACLHPALRALRAPIAYQCERWADEQAAAAVGDRRLAARAVGRAALAASATPLARRPASVLTATAGPVPRRMSALLAPPPSAGPLARRAGAVVLLLLLVSATATAEAADALHDNIEVAQGPVERPRPAH